MTCLISCPSGKWEWKVTCPEGKSTCLGRWDGTFFEPWFTKSGSCVLKASAVKCQSILSIDPPSALHWHLDWHLVNISINTQLTLKPGSHLWDKHNTSEISTSISTRKRNMFLFPCACTYGYFTCVMLISQVWTRLKLTLDWYLNWQSIHTRSTVGW